MRWLSTTITPLDELIAMKQDDDGGFFLVRVGDNDTADEVFNLDPAEFDAVHDLISDTSATLRKHTEE